MGGATHRLLTKEKTSAPSTRVVPYTVNDQQTVERAERDDHAQNSDTARVDSRLALTTGLSPLLGEVADARHVDRLMPRC